MNEHALHGRPPELAPSLTGVPGDPRRAMEQLSSMGFRWVQLGITQPGLRPRDLDGSARRDLLARLRRTELDLSGLDFFIPVEHYFDPARADRAVSATRAAIDLAADLGRCPVNLVLPAATEDDDHARASSGAELREAISDAARRSGVPLADYAAPPTVTEPGDLIGVGIDPAICLGRGEDPAAMVSRPRATIVAARLCDCNTAGQRAPLGEPGGRLDVLTYGIALVTVGYDRPVIIDARQWTEPWRGIEQTAEVWRTQIQISA